MKKRIGQALLIILFHLGTIAWLYFGIVTATTLR